MVKVKNIATKAEIVYEGDKIIKKKLKDKDEYEEIEMNKCEVGDVIKMFVQKSTIDGVDIYIDYKIISKAA